MADLFVDHADFRVGTLREVDPGNLRFWYDERWMASEDGFPISLSMPFAREPYDDVAHRFFANLLPEGLVRQRLCQRLGISVDNDAALLRAIGGDCAGALSVGADMASSSDDHYELIDDALVESWAGGEAALSMVTGTGQVRLSLAGAQDKLPVKADDDGFWLPLDKAPSTHLLKFPSADFKHLIANEALMMMTARKLGLPVATVSVRDAGGLSMLLIERYDRRTVDQRAVRVHQEDLCQALGLPHLRKYEREGGPTLAQCAALIRARCLNPARDLEALLRWSIFNVVAGNADAHGKNVSFLIEPSGISLAPFYDLVCTRAYKNLDRRGAMRIGGKDDPGEISAANWREAAKDLGVQPRLMIDLVEEITGALSAAFEEASAEYSTAYGRSPVISTIGAAIGKQIKRTKALLS